MERVRVTVGDITQETSDAIVNAANSSLLGGVGVDGAIHRAGGPSILSECQLLRKTRYPQGLPTGSAVITTAGRLKTRFVIHTVGPIWRGGKESESKLLASCYRNSLDLAMEKGLETISFPAISTGVYGYPTDQASKIVSATLRSWLLEHPTEMKEIALIFFSPQDRDIFQAHCVWS